MSVEYFPNNKRWYMLQKKSEKNFPCGIIYYSNTALMCENCKMACRAAEKIIESCEAQAEEEK